MGLGVVATDSLLVINWCSPLASVLTRLQVQHSTFPIGSIDLFRNEIKLNKNSVIQYFAAAVALYECV